MKKVLFGFCFIILLASSVWAAGDFPMPDICNRICWVARDPQCSISQEPSLNRAVIHHTEVTTDYETTSLEFSAARVRAHQNYHMDSLGWCDIGYHFLVDKLGNRFEGREGSISSLPRGAHDGVNTCSMGFSCMGDYRNNRNDPTVEMRQALYDLIAWKIPDPFNGYGGGAYGSQGLVGYLCGHMDAVSTTCPGDLLYAYIGTDLYGGEARNEVYNRITGGAPTPTPTPTPEPGTDIIVDNDEGAPAYIETGTWSTSTSSGYNDGTYRYASAGGAHTATWMANLSETGAYEVFVIYRASSNRATSVKYDIFASDGTYPVYIDQTVNNLVWVSLGYYSFNAGDNSIMLDAAGSSGGDVVIADAVRFTLTTGPTPTPTPTPAPPPAAPSNLNAVAISTTQVDLTWDDNSSDEDNFIIERKRSVESSYTVIDSVPANTTSYSDFDVRKGTTYNYRVKAVNSNGDSDYSNVATVTTPKK